MIMKKIKGAAVFWGALAGLLTSPPALGADGDLIACSKVTDDAQRLSCYDRLSKQRSSGPESPVVAISENAGNPADLKAAPDHEISPLSRHWEIDPGAKAGLWTFRAHKPNYFLLGRYTDHVNDDPYDAYFNLAGDPDFSLNNVESKFQFSFKLKAAEDLFARGVDVWLGYTQQSHWQAHSNRISSPFRETNYEPEMFVTVPTDYDFLGLRGRFVNLGFVHQSNGQSHVLSRSWNRVYAQAGFEYGDNFSLLFKPWYRIPEKAADDDNPRIADYIGDFELLASYRHANHRFSALGRSTFDFRRGYLQLDWSYPIYQKLRGYVQFTTGYGESLIDYDHRQSTLGIGVLLTDWM